MVGSRSLRSTRVGLGERNTHHWDDWTLDALMGAKSGPVPAAR